MAKSKNKKSKVSEKQTLNFEEMRHNLYLMHRKVDIMLSQFDNISNYDTLTHVVSFAGGVIVTFVLFGALIILKKWGL